MTSVYAKYGRLARLFFFISVHLNAKIMKKLMVGIVLALFAWNIQPAIAQKPGVVIGNEPGWQKIGETVASFKSQDESISVIGADEFSAIKIRVKDAPLEIERMQVFYES